MTFPGHVKRKLTWMEDMLAELNCHGGHLDIIVKRQHFLNDEALAAATAQTTRGW